MKWHCSTGQNPQWAVVPMEEEEEEVFVSPWGWQLGAETCSTFSRLLYDLYLIVCFCWRVKLIVSLMHGIYCTVSNCSWLLRICNCSFRRACNSVSVKLTVGWVAIHYRIRDLWDINYARRFVFFLRTFNQMQEYYLNFNHDYILPTIFRLMTHQSPHRSGG